MTKTKPMRVDAEYEKLMKEIMQERFRNNLANFNQKELGFPEATRLQLRCPSWKNVENELRTLPKRAKNGK